MEISYFAIIIGAIFVNNVVLAQFLGICPFLGVSSKVETSLGMGAAVTFVMALTAVVAWSIQTFILDPLGIGYMQTIVFILVIAALVQMVEIMLKKVSPSLYQALGKFLPLRRFGCGHTYDPEGVQPAAECNVLRIDRVGLRPCTGDLRRHTRATGAGRCARSLEGYPDSADYGRYSGHGLHGILGTGIEYRTMRLGGCGVTAVTL